MKERSLRKKETSRYNRVNFMIRSILIKYVPE